MCWCCRETNMWSIVEFSEEMVEWFESKGIAYKVHKDMEKIMWFEKKGIVYDINRGMGKIMFDCTTARHIIDDKNELVGTDAIWIVLEIMCSIDDEDPGESFVPLCEYSNRKTKFVITDKKEKFTVLDYTGDNLKFNANLKLVLTTGQ